MLARIEGVEIEIVQSTVEHSSSHRSRYQGTMDVLGDSRRRAQLTVLGGAGDFYPGQRIQVGDGGNELFEGIISHVAVDSSGTVQLECDEATIGDLMGKFEPPIKLEREQPPSRDPALDWDW